MPDITVVLEENARLKKLAIKYSEDLLRADNQITHEWGDNIAACLKEDEEAHKKRLAEINGNS